jgi:hypothetical protein
MDICLVNVGLCVRLISPPEESCRMWCLTECDGEGCGSLEAVVPWKKKNTYFETFTVGMHTFSINLGVALKFQAL